jgi:acyl dehydratase
MSSIETLTFASVPSMVPAYARVIFGRKPYFAPSLNATGEVEVEVPRVTLRASHLRKYCEVCAIPPSDVLPPAFLHVVAMPLHMQLFNARSFPVKVLGLIHLRNTIRVFERVGVDQPVRLRVSFNTVRTTEIGQEYDFTTRACRGSDVVWEEVSTMLARNPNATPKRQALDRSTHPKDGDVLTVTADIGKNTGWRYASVSGDYNPIHLTARTASWFGFKQAVAHGMWSLARSLGAAQPRLPTEKLQIDCQFKLPVYLPSQAIVRAWEQNGGVDVSMSTPRGDRLHLAMQVRQI